MLRAMVLGAALAFAAGTAHADKIKLFDQTGAAVEVDTAKVQGCERVFDSDGAAFEICRLQKVEMRPPSSTRVRPGHAASNERSSVVYTKTSN